LQQPPLQVSPPAQLVPHWCVVVLHAVPEGQSFDVVQPQLAPPRQAVPVGLPVQSEQVAPVAPHAAGAVPPTQLPDEQQPPLQVRPPAQLVPQACVEGLHAFPDGQSLDVLQPHCPLTHAEPADEAAQLTHAPGVPQLAVVPAHAPGTMSGGRDRSGPDVRSGGACRSPDDVKSPLDVRSMDPASIAAVSSSHPLRQAASPIAAHSAAPWKRCIGLLAARSERARPRAYR
jgi:hypothetical protein